MKVQSLIDYLSDLDPNANVIIMSQESWPFENELKGVVTRQELLSEWDEDVQAEGLVGTLREGEEYNDVFLVEGDQLRRGDKKAWHLL